MRDTVVVATHAHKDGRDVRVFAQETSAEQWRRDIADEWWIALIGDAAPADPKERADLFWSRIDGQSFSTQRFALE
jgi:hypothetical protein